MGYPINYLVEVPGAEFNRLLCHPYPGMGKSVDEMMEDGGWIWESRLPCSDLGFDFNLTGARWTLCSIPANYSLLLHTENPAAQAKLEAVYDAEKCLRSLIGSSRIYRIDYCLVEQWDTKYDYHWLHDEKLIDDFLDWLSTQEAWHWSIMP
jgi:hypothetical protein